MVSSINIIITSNSNKLSNAANQRQSFEYRSKFVSLIFKALCTITFHHFQGTRQAVERHTEENCQQHLALVSALASRQARQLETLRATVSRLSNTTNCSGALVWKISDWAAKMAEAKCKDGVELVSSAFYTSQYGYKLQVG